MTLSTLAFAMALAAILLTLLNMVADSRVEDWHRLWLTRRGHVVHVRTDPNCAYHRPAPRGSRLDRATRGVTCLRCRDDGTR